MRLFLYFIIPVIVCSCGTQQKFEVTARTRDSISFTSAYRPFNKHGGKGLQDYVVAARDYTVDEALASCRTENRETASIALNKGVISYSLSGYYTFKIDGELKFGPSPKGGLTVMDSTGLMTEAEQREWRNHITGMIISPTVTSISDALHDKTNPRTPKYRYHITD